MNPAAPNLYHFPDRGENPTRPGGYTGFTYAYDANGNITAINESNGTTSRTRTYTYDALNRLKTDSDPVTGKTTTYTYDARGNILSKNVSGQTVTYTYGDSTWKDLLTAYDGVAITYDNIGNPLYYRGNTFTWQQGRQLASATTASGKNVTYRYNTDGIRIGKTVNGVNTEYLVDTAGAIHAMKQGNHTLIFMYDSTGRREGFICYSDTYGDAAYYYLYNAQGDVIGLTDGSLNTVVQYTYNAWGKLISTTGSKANTIGKLNPFRYRGYVYDEETELYYVSSRYYDPEVGRFINADTTAVLTATPTALMDKNLFAYCNSNPTNYTATVSIEKPSAATESYCTDTASIPVEISIRIKYDVPLYDQGSYSLCWAFSQVMIEDYLSNISRNNGDATERAKEIAISVYGAQNWNQGGWPTNSGKRIMNTEITSIGALFYSLLQYGPMYVYYGGASGAHLIVVTGVDLAQGIIYTNNPWGIYGEQSYSQFVDGFAGMPSDWEMPLGFYLLAS